jgi:hypothetical protein
LEGYNEEIEIALAAGQKVLRIGRVKPHSGTQPGNADARTTLVQSFSLQFGRASAP